MFVLTLLGGAAVHGPAGALGGRLVQRRRLALLAVLAAAGSRPVNRDRLLALFWPESDTERARHSLADTIYQIRRALGDGAVLSSGDHVWLDGEVISSDLRRFEAAIARGEPSAAVAAYAGPFMDGFHLSDLPDFERWVDDQRGRAARLHAQALEQLATDAAARQDPRRAVEWWRRLSAADPYSARVTLGLMSALTAAGDRAGAIQQARAHAALLEQDFAAAPDPEVQALAEWLRRGGPTAPAEGRNAGAAVPDARVAPPAPPAADTEPAPAGRERASTSIQLLQGPARVHVRGWSILLLLAALGAAVGVTLAVRRLPSAVEARSTGATDADVAGRTGLVVLPCESLGGDRDVENFSGGLTEELITALSQVRSLRVVARTSVVGLPARHADVRDVGRSLNVGTVLQCSVRRSGDRFSVTAQLISVADGLHLWAESYRRESTDMLALQGDLAQRVTDALEAKLTPWERGRLMRRPTTSPEAWASYLKGRHFWNQRTAGSLRQAVAYFERAIALDSQYAAAHAGLARAYSLQGLSGELTPQEAQERMRVAALRAVAFDDGLAEAHAELGAYLHVYAWEARGAEQAYLRAIELDPGYSIARHLYGNFLWALGRYEEAVAQKRVAASLDPLSPSLASSLGHALLAAGRLDEALEAFRGAVELDSTYWGAHAGLGALHTVMGRREEAVRAHRRAVARSNDNSHARADLARALADAGRVGEARQLVARLREEGRRRGIYAPRVANALFALGDTAEAFEWLERSYRQRHPQLRLMSHSGDAGLAESPRYRDLLRRVGLPPPAVHVRPQAGSTATARQERAPR